MDRTPPQGELSDAELISSVRGGDVSAYGDLFARHRDAATRLARQLVSGPDADDLVSEAFAKVLNVLLAGGGPDVAFRAYLLTAVRRLHVDKIRATNRAMPTDDLTPYDEGEPFKDTVIAGFEGGAAARAYASLPERWQLVLWHLEVEGQKPADVAPLLGMTPNSVSALAYRAREGLRQAYLQMHSADIGDAECRWVHDKMGAYVRKGLSRRDAAKVEEHLKTCRKCTALFVELSEVNSSMAGVIAPAVLGSAAVAYLGGSAKASIVGGYLAGASGSVAAAFARVREAIAGQGQVAIGLGAAFGVAGIAVVGVLLSNSGGNDHPPIAEPKPSQTIGVPSTPTPTPTPTKTPSTSPTSEPTSVGTVVSPPSSTPTSNPSHHPSHHPTGPATPPITPPTTPPTTPSGPTSADMRVAMSFTPKLGLLGAKNAGTIGNITAQAAGLPAGTTSTITVQVLGGTLQQIPTTTNARRAAAAGAPGTCQINGGTAVCVVAPNTPPFQFEVLGLPVAASADVSTPDNVEDTHMDNNHDSLLLGLL